ncbi:MAG: TIGR03618 family F420-dependent PPOX class oxidoreductase [Ilumatobacteraceae bacterium]
MANNQRAQITMDDDEIATYIDQHRTATMATNGPTGTPHVVAMWYAVIDGAIWFETKSRSQKAENLRRDSRITCMLEDGATYATLRGVSIEGNGVIVDDPEMLWQVGVNVWERYTGPFTDEMRPLVESMLRKRIAVRVDVDRIRSWDHNKLGLPPMAIGGTTAAHLAR